MNRQTVGGGEQHVELAVAVHVGGESVFGEEGLHAGEHRRKKQFHSCKHSGRCLARTRSYFDTNVTDHHHFLIEETSEVMDIPADHLSLDTLPEPPEGMEIARVDVVVRLRRKSD